MAVFKAAGFVIFRKVSGKIQYLLLQASYGNHHWTPPKGFVEYGEKNDLETAYRETEEEAGFNASDLKVYEDSKKTLQYNVKGKLKTVVYWLAELINLEALIKLSGEHRDFKWLELNEAITIGKYREMEELLRFCDDYIKKNSL